MPRFNLILRAMIASTMIVGIMFAAIASTRVSAQSRKGTATSSTPTPEAAATPSPSTSPAAPPIQKKIAAASPETKPVIDAKAEQILRRAVEALGGNSYTNVRSEIGRGLFTPFRDGVSGLPSSFVDYIVFPDRERTEFHSSDGHVIQTNVGAKGWIFDGAKRSIKDMTPEQAEDFRFAMRTSIDSLLRGLWRSKESGITLAYIGRREAGLAKRNEAVRLTYADGLAVEFEFGARDGLPAKVTYTRKDSEGKEAPEEDRFAQFVSTNGVLAPFIIDHYRAGVQASRINYKSLDFNANIGDEVFNKPASLKELKVK